MAIPFWPKIAGVEDAPNYRPTAGDSRCETCSYFRALNDGVGYCERFSFEAEPQSVCDEFVGAGRTKVSSASITDRLKDLYNNPVARRIALSSGIGAAAGGASAARGTGEDRYLEGAKGALAGGLIGGLAGGVGPLLRRSKAKKEYAEAGEKIKSMFDAEKKTLSDLRDTQQELQQSRRRAISAKRDSKLSDNEKLKRIGEFQKLYKNNPDIDKKVSSQSLKVKELNTALKNRSKYKDDLESLAEPSSDYERYGAPALSGLVSAGLGFGLSDYARQQERLRQFQNKRK
jgi:gas vesicle protein